MALRKCQGSVDTLSGAARVEKDKRQRAAKRAKDGHGKLME